MTFRDRAQRVCGLWAGFHDFGLGGGFLAEARGGWEAKANPNQSQTKPKANPIRTHPKPISCQVENLHNVL
jgi:hypothetical protein